VLHVVALAADEAAQMQDNTAGLVALPEDCDIGVLKGGEFLLVPLPLALELLGDLLLEHQSLEGIVALLLRSAEADSEAGVVVLLLVEEAGQAPVFALVALDLDLEVLRLLGKLFGEGLELEELGSRELACVPCE
jgi:hypothetical protein